MLDIIPYVKNINKYEFGNHFTDMFNKKNIEKSL